MLDLNALQWSMLLNILVAALCGACFGLEREMHRRPAGLRTNMMVCVGAALYTYASLNLGSDRAAADPTRIASQIVVGIGFIGAGTIWQYGKEEVISGLTSAATIWVVAAIGVYAGSDRYEMALGATAIALVILGGLRSLEKSIFKSHKLHHLQLKLECAPTNLDVVRFYVDSLEGRVVSLNEDRQSDGEIQHVDVVYTARKAAHQHIRNKLSQLANLIDMDERTATEGEDV